MHMTGFGLFCGEGVEGELGEKKDEMERCDFVVAGVEGFPGEKKDEIGSC